MKTKQLGITLVESIATLGIMSAIAVGTVVLSNEYTQDTRTAGAAEHMRIVAQAAQAYVKDNRGVILSQATTTTPVMVTTAMLSTAGYLPPGFSVNNSYGQNVCALVLEPSAGALSTMIVGEGGEALDDVTLAHFSSTMGAGGGGRFRSNGTVLQGAGGGWSMPLGTFHNRVNTLNQRCNGVAAGNVQIELGTPVYASWMDATGTADPGFLSRDVVPGNPVANTMQTNINMGGNRIANMNSVSVGASCPAGTTNGELANGPNGEVVSCLNGTWTISGKAYWGGNVTTFGALPGCAASNMGETRRVTNISGVFVCNGLRWDSAMNESNNFSLPQRLQVAGNANISGSASISGNASISGSSSVGGAVNHYSTTNLHGATTTHSSLNANAGINVGAGQTIYNPGTLHVEAAGNLYLKPWAGGGQVVVGGGGGNGNLHATGRVTANGSHAVTAQSNDWSVIARDAGGGLNAAPTNSAGSMHVNDVYVRSAEKWLSQIANTSGGKFWPDEGGAPCPIVNFGGFNSYGYYGYGGTAIRPVHPSSGSILSGQAKDLLQCQGATTVQLGRVLCVNGRVIQLNAPICDYTRN